MRETRPPPPQSLLARGTQPIAPVTDDHGALSVVADVEVDDEPPQQAHACAATHARRALPKVDLSAIDETTIRNLDRHSLEVVVNVCHHLAGLTPLCTFAGITDDELRQMAIRALARVKAQR